MTENNEGVGPKESEPEEIESKTEKKDDKSPQEIIPAEIADRLPGDFKELINKVGGDRETVMRIISIVEEYSGAVPHPRIIAQFQKIMPDAPDRLFTMAEKQQDHRQYLEKRVIEGDVKRADTGLILGFVLFISFAIGGMGLLFVGKDIQGYVALATSLIGGIGNFIRVGRERQKAVEAQKKRRKRKFPNFFGNKKTTKENQNKKSPA